MPPYPQKATYRTFVIDAQTGKWKQIEIKDIPIEKRRELWDRFALGGGLPKNSEITRLSPKAKS